MKKILSYTVVTLAILELLLVVGSWIVCTVFPESSFHTMLSSEGIRWFFGSFVGNLRSECLVWLLLFAVAFGCIGRSGMMHAVKKLFLKTAFIFRERIALMLCLAETAVFLVVMLLLTCMPQAVLLSVTGDLFPSIFSASILPSVAFLFLLLGSTYGFATRSFRSASSWVGAMAYGVECFSYIFVAYIFAMQFFCSLRFVLSL